MLSSTAALLASGIPTRISGTEVTLGGWERQDVVYYIVHVKIDWDHKGALPIWRSIFTVTRVMSGTISYSCMTVTPKPDQNGEQVSHATQKQVLTTKPSLIYIRP